MIRSHSKAVNRDASAKIGAFQVSEWSFPNVEEIGSFSTYSASHFNGFLNAPCHSGCCEMKYLNN